MTALVRLLPLALLAIACAGLPPPIKPMTIAEHESAADAELEIAGGFAANDDPIAQHGVVIGPMPNAPVNVDLPTRPPTTYDQIGEEWAALDHAGRARAHRRAAARLLQAEVDACAPFTRAERAACPAVRAVHVEKTGGGVRAFLADSVDTDDIAARVQCHVAYADAFGENAACPIYQRGERVSVKDGAIVFTIDDKHERAEVYAFLNRE
jgi:hypothetical protein